MSSPDPLAHTDDVSTQQQKMIASINRQISLTQDLVECGKILNDIKGKYAEIKAKLRVEKEIVNGLKVTIRAEAQGYNG